MDATVILHNVVERPSAVQQHPHIFDTHLIRPTPCEAAVALEGAGRAGGRHRRPGSAARRRSARGRGDRRGGAARDWSTRYGGQRGAVYDHSAVHTPPTDGGRRARRRGPQTLQGRKWGPLSADGPGRGRGAVGAQRRSSRAPRPPSRGRRVREGACCRRAPGSLLHAPRLLDDGDGAAGHGRLGDEAAVLGADHIHAGLGALGAGLSRLELALEVAHAGDVLRRHLLLLLQLALVHVDLRRARERVRRT